MGRGSQSEEDHEVVQGSGLPQAAAESPAVWVPPLPPIRPWEPPTDVELRLFTAKSRGDWGAYLEVVAESLLFHPVPRAYADRHPRGFGFFPYRVPPVGTCWLPVYTIGQLPDPRPDPVFLERDLSWLAREWEHHIAGLAVNPGSPSEGYLPAMHADRHTWLHYAGRAQRTAHRNTVRTLRTGPQQGQVARGLACGALLCVHNGSLWNALGWHGTGYDGERERLADWWGITSPEQWSQTVEQLLRGKASSAVWEFVLEIRQAIARTYGGLVDASHWREAVARVVRQRADMPAPDDEIDKLHRLIGRITRYEARFRADGLLSPGAQTTSVLAWDYGRASKMARWGLGARLCTMGQAEEVIVRAGRVSQVTYSSWEAFSVGYILGRCLHFDDETFSDWYQSMLDAHRVLTTDPASPWLTIPWR